MKKPRRWRIGAVLAGVLVASMALLVATSLYGEYGAHNINLAIVRYMREHDRCWPAGWDDIKPYHRDPILPIRSVAVVRLFHEVAWEIDPHQLFADHDPGGKLRADGEKGVLPVVYRRNLRPAGEPVRHWMLTPIIRRYLEEEAGDREEP